MKIILEIDDLMLEDPEHGMVPSVNMVLKLEDEKAVIDGEPTPSMWTGAAIFDLHKSGKLMDLTLAFIASGNEAKSG